MLCTCGSEFAKTIVFFSRTCIKIGWAWVIQKCYWFWIVAILKTIILLLISDLSPSIIFWINNCVFVEEFVNKQPFFVTGWCFWELHETLWSSFEYDLTALETEKSPKLLPWLFRYTSPLKLKHLQRRMLKKKGLIILRNKKKLLLSGYPKKSWC